MLCTQFDALEKQSLYLSFSDGQKVTVALGFKWHTGCISTQHPANPDLLLKALPCVISASEMDEDLMSSCSN